MSFSVSDLIVAEEIGNSIVMALPKPKVEDKPEGFKEDYSLSISDEPTILDFRSFPLYKFTLFNDGVDDIYFSLNRDEAVSDTPIKKGESAVVDLEGTDIWKIILWCSSGGSAGVRIQALR